MTDRESVIVGLQNCKPSWFTVEKCSDDSCPYNRFGHEDGGCVDHLIDDVLELLKEQTIESTPWICHLYKTGSKRFECGHCHKTSWRNSPYCPDCGTKMDGMVIMDD